MFIDTSIIAMTTIGALPMSVELQNLVFEFTYGSTALYQHKIEFAPVFEELNRRMNYYRSVEKKVLEFCAMLSQYKDQGAVQSFSTQRIQYSPQAFAASGFRKLVKSSSELNVVIITINWTNRSSGPREVEVYPHPFNGSIYVTDLMHPSEEDDEYDEHSCQYEITLELFSSHFRIRELM